MQRISNASNVTPKPGAASLIPLRILRKEQSIGNKTTMESTLLEGNAKAIPKISNAWNVTMKFETAYLISIRNGCLGKIKM